MTSPLYRKRVKKTDADRELDAMEADARRCLDVVMLYCCRMIARYRQDMGDDRPLTERSVKEEVFNRYQDSTLAPIGYEEVEASLKRAKNVLTEYDPPLIRAMEALWDENYATALHACARVLLNHAGNKRRENVDKLLGQLRKEIESMI
jgi:hypothetical protein